MNKAFITLLIFGLFSCSVKKQENISEPNVKFNNIEKNSQIEFESEMHDFGKIKSGEILTFSFVFSNKGKTDLVIENAESDCGCVQANIPKKAIYPGEKGIIEVEFNSTGLLGKQLKTIEIQSNSKEPKHLIIFAEVENELFDIKN